MTNRALTARERASLRKALMQCEEIRHYRRLVALLEIGQGRSIVAVAATAGVSLRSVYTWIDAFRAAGVAGLTDQPHPGRPSRWDEPTREVLRELLASTPQAYAYPAMTWTVPLLAEQLRHQAGWDMTEKTLRREIHDLGYTWKRSRYVLAPDPQAEKKTRPHPGIAHTG